MHCRFYTIFQPTLILKYIVMLQSPQKVFHQKTGEEIECYMEDKIFIKY